MKTILLTSLFVVLCFCTGYSQRTIIPTVKVLGLDLYGFKTLEDRLSHYKEKGYIKSDFKGHPEEPMSVAYQSFEYEGSEAIYEVFYNDQKEVYKVSLYFGPELGKWKTFTDEVKMRANNNAYFNLLDMIIKEVGEPTVARSYAWKPFHVDDLKSPARFLAGADADKVGYFANWFNDGEVMHDSPISIDTHSARMNEISVTDWRVQEAARKAARPK